MERSSTKPIKNSFEPVLKKLVSPGKFLPGKPESETASRDCEAHGPYIAKLEYHQVMNRHYENACPKCIAAYEADRETQERVEKHEQAKALLEIKLANAGITKRFRCKSFDNFEADTLPKRRALESLKNYAKRFDENLEQGRSIILHGKTGTGKNHLASALVIQLINNNHNPLLVKLFDLVSEVKATWNNKDLCEHQVLKKFQNCDLLVVDEVGVQFASDAEKLILFNVLNNRYENVKPTIVISNYPIDSENGPSIRKVLGDRILDRLRENGGTQIAFDWQSHRN